MKKNINILLSVLVFIILSDLTYSQGKFEGGFTVGINGSQIDGDSMSGYNKGGLRAGVFIDYPISKKTYISFEMLYSMKGSREKDNVDYSDPNYTPGPWFMLRLSYLEVPLIINFKWNEKIIVYGGIGAGILVGSKFIDIDKIENPDAKPIRTFDLIPQIGLKYQPFPRIAIFTQFSYSILNIGKDKSKTLLSRTNRGMHNNVISAGIRFYLGAKSNSN
jgi:hypothetical protein